MAVRTLRLHKSRKEVLHIIIIIGLSNPANILIRPQNHTRTSLRIDAIVLINLAMSFMVRFIVDKHLPVIPSSRLVEWVEDVGEIQEVNFSPRARMDGEDLNYAVNFLAHGCEPVDEGVLASKSLSKLHHSVEIVTVLEIAREDDQTPSAIAFQKFL